MFCGVSSHADWQHWHYKLLHLLRLKGILHGSNTKGDGSCSGQDTDFSIADQAAKFEAADPPKGT